MAIEYEVTYHQIDKTTWAVLVENGEWSIGHIIKQGKRILLELWEPCGLHELEQILSKMKELHGSKVAVFEDNLPDDYEVN